MTKSWGEIVRETVGQPIGPATGLYQGEVAPESRSNDTGSSQSTGCTITLLLMLGLIVLCLCGTGVLYLYVG